ncbi:hypothetical protein BDM02DRAFT_3271889 [Thelephora ganbajun]|uniref:Uncharacterized protein n=1 Tax=Thelephora ganbajun TaxID=370292 RepID=A0ACB6Z6D3_THEGA|nr:hypothetical protein BDM02DRAFT_3271889 [Thelephora ganbajun]
MPTSKVVVELSACGMTPESSDIVLSQQCQTVCQAVIDAQQHCKRDAPCTCSTVLPDILQTCIQCSVDQIPQDRLPEILSLIPPRLRAYADVCNQPIPDQQLAIFRNVTTYAYAREASSSTSEPTLAKREVDNTHCLFGLPEVVEMRYQWSQFSQSTGLQGLQPWPVILFVFVAGLCYAENRRSKRAGKA